MSPGQISTLILPSDTCWNPGGVVGKPLPVPPAPMTTPHAVKVAAQLLRAGKKTLLLLGGNALRADTLAEAARICAATGATMMSQGSNGRIERGRGRHPINGIPYPVDQAVAALKDFETIILVGTLKPVIFFAYPNKPGSPVRADATLHPLSRPEHNQLQALQALAEELGSPAAVAAPSYGTVELAKGAISSEAFAQSLTAMMPEQAIIVNEAVTFGRAFVGATHGAAQHDWLTVTGGAIGGGMPISTGAAVAAPGRRVINLQADGSAMYTIQSLWTQAREKLDVTTVIFNNRKYQILLGELANVGANPGRTALDMMDLGNPDIDFVKIAGGMGVEGARAETMEQFNDLFAQSLSRKGPFLIDLKTA
jgi:acetolactate synthase-1/2/3 large subunit